MKKEAMAVYFELFTEIGIISQLSRALLENQLPKGFVQIHFSVLNHLMRVGDGVTPLQIAQAHQVPKTSMTHTLSGLEKHGLILISPNPNDGRSKCVYLTDAGKEFVQQSLFKMSEKIKVLDKNMDLEQIKNVLPDLKAIRKLLDDNR